MDLRTGQGLAGHRNITMLVRYSHLSHHNQKAIEVSETRTGPGWKGSNRQRRAGASF